MQGYRSLLFCLLVLTVTACTSNDLRGGNDEEPFSPTPVSLGDLGSRAEDLPALLELIRDGNPYKKKAASERLVELSRNQGDRFSEPLINEISRLCSTRGQPLEYDKNFDAVTLLAGIIAERQDVSALDALVDCADFRGGIGGSSLNSRATGPAIVSYKKKAVPTLKKKLPTSSPAVKCEIADILSILAARSELSPREAETILNNALKTENDKNVRYCLEGDLRVVSKHK